MYRRDAPKLDAQTLNYLYCECGMSIRDIATTTGCSYSTIRRLMKKFGINARDYRNAEFNLRKVHPEIYEARLQSLRRVRGTFTGKERLMRDIRQAIAPLIAYYKQHHPLCEACGIRNTSEVHHVLPLSSLVNRFYNMCNGNYVETVFQLVKMHYDGSIELVALCKECHAQIH